MLEVVCKFQRLQFHVGLKSLIFRLDETAYCIQNFAGWLKQSVEIEDDDEVQ